MNGKQEGSLSSKSMSPDWDIMTQEELIEACQELAVMARRLSDLYFTLHAAPARASEAWVVTPSSAQASHMKAKE